MTQIGQDPLPTSAATIETVTEWGLRLHYGDGPEADRILNIGHNEYVARDYKRIYGEDITLFRREIEQRVGEWQEVDHAE